MSKALVAVLLLYCSASFAQGPSWHGRLTQIIPTVSTKSDVDRLFPNRAEGRFSVYIATGKCTLGEYSKLVPKDTILQITFFPVNAVSLSQFKLAMSEFRETMENDNPTTHFVSSKLGLDYSTQRKRVISVTLFPRGYSSDSFSCK
jgi:hypothetical protein